MDTMPSNDELRASIAASREAEQQALDMMKFTMSMMQLQIEVLETIAMALEPEPPLYVAPNFKFKDPSVNCVRRAWEEHCDLCGQVSIGVCVRVVRSSHEYGKVEMRAVGNDGTTLGQARTQG